MQVYIFANERLNVLNCTLILRYVWHFKTNNVSAPTFIYFADVLLSNAYSTSNGYPGHFWDVIHRVSVD